MIKTPKTGRILISEPFLEDPNFNRTIVLLAEHGEEGTVGYVLNQSTAMTVDLLMPDLEMVKNKVYQGGPVEIESFHYIHTYGKIDGAVDLGKGVYWSGSYEAVIEGISSGEFAPENFRFFVGYSGWGTNQLMDEINEDAWVVGDLHPSVLFDTDLNDYDLWKEAMIGLGGEFALLANSPSNPQMN